jgi:hypothetical protein
MVVPWRSGALGSVRASMKNSLPTGALAMKHFSPFRIHSSPLRSARSFSPALGASFGGRRLSEPAVGSVMPLPSRKRWSATNGRRNRSFCSPLQACWIRWLHFQLSHHQRLRHVVGAFAAVFLGHRHGAEAKLRSLLHDVPVERAVRVGRLVELQGDRLDLFLGEFARDHLPGALLVTQ